MWHCQQAPLLDLCLHEGCQALPVVQTPFLWMFEAHLRGWRSHPRSDLSRSQVWGSPPWCPVLRESPEV